MPEPTPSQTIGPFFHFALLQEDRSSLVDPDDPGSIRIEGTVSDGAGDPVPDAMIEVLQSDARGGGLGRCGTDENGGFAFVVARPGPAPDDRAPHLLVSVFARGLLRRLETRMYLPGEGANATDPVLLSVEDPARRATLVAEDAGETLRFDIRLQGEGQTVFFDV